MLANKGNELKRITANETIMDIVVKHAKTHNKSKEIIMPINQGRLLKKMHLPCKLVRFEGSKVTKEARMKEKSNIL